MCPELIRPVMRQSLDRLPDICLVVASMGLRPGQAQGKSQKTDGDRKRDEQPPLLNSEA